ncbi:MAG TPA: DNA polymerase III subunit delta [Devosia sp.]|nr:DNA polymerase III subunit delta [Devosia sp.]
MSALKAHDVERFVAHPDLGKGVFLVYGSDAGLVRETAGKLISRFLKDKSPQSHSSLPPSPTTLDMAEIDADPALLAIAARTTSLFGDAPVIRIRNAGNALAPILAEMLQDIPDAPVIVEAGNLSPQDRLRALAERSGSARALPCYSDNATSLTSLIRQTFADEKINIESEALAFLRDSLGNDREVTRRELEKLAAYASESKILTIRDVTELCGDNTAITTDRIVDATGTGHALRLEDAINRANAASLDPQRILVAALNHFLFLRRAKALINKGLSTTEVLKRSRPRPHFSRNASIEQQLRLWNDVQLALAAERMNKTIHLSRQQPALTGTFTRRALLALCLAASQR